MKLEEVKADRNDLIAIEEAAVRSMFTQKVNLSKRSDAFTLGERDKILDQVSRPTSLPSPRFDSSIQPHFLFSSD
jgi:hypothetical protein